MDKPIGVIDSGLGGLTVAKEIMRQLPKERVIYIGDSARCPYGPRPVEEVRDFTWDMINRLLQEDIKLLVIACNTATAVVLEEARSKILIPVIGVVQPGAISALKMTNNKHIAILGTAGTIASNTYEETLLEIDNEVKVESLACPKFVPIVEQGAYGTEEAREIVRNTLLPIHGLGFDTVILGCTHYPLLKDLIQEALGEAIQLISSGDETAREVSSILQHSNLNNVNKNKQTHVFYTTGSADSFRFLANLLLDLKLEAVQEIQLGKERILTTN